MRMIFTCCMCGEELHPDCYHQRDEETGWRDWKFCVECWNVSQPFLKQMFREEAQHHRKTMEITEDMQAACRKAKEELKK